MNDSNPDTASQIPIRLQNWPLVVGLSVMAVVAALSYSAHQPPAPLTVDVAANLFSAMRADQYLEKLVGDGIPHPAGTKQNQIVQRRVQEILESFGYETEIHSSSSAPFVLDNQGPFELTNVIANLEGNGKYRNEPRHKIALVAHYDSHPAGPGASDDGVGTAALLEVARMLKLQSIQKSFDRDIVFLITDGEEYGLLGAKKFVEEHPLAKQIGVVVNLEARGSSGASLMFQSGSESRWLIKHFASHSANPRTSSLFYEVYRHMPNDTDFTVFDRDGAQGYNFAFIGDVRHYHTPEDNYENADRGSLQHHGQNALAMMRVLANLDIQNQPKGRAVYFDVLGQQVIWWPASWSIFICVFCLVVLVFWIIKLSRKELLLFPGLLAGGVWVLLFVVVVAISGILLSVGFSFDDRFELAWPESPIPIALAFWFLAVAAIGFLSSVFRAPNTLVQVSCGVVLLWTILATVSSVVMTGASYLFIVPAISMSVLSVVALLLEKPGQNLLSNVAIIVALLVVCVVWLPTEFLFYDVIGFKTVALPAVGRVMLLPIVRVTIVLSALVPLFFVADRSFRMLVSGVCMSATIISLIWAVVGNG